MKHFSLALLLCLFPFITSAHDNDTRVEKEYDIELSPVNNSGVEAEVEIKLLNGNMLHVSIEASGLEPGKVHPQHIHGIDNPLKNATCPGIEADTDGDGVISVGEGLPSYGPIILPLLPFNLVDAEGKLKYEASFTINPDALQPLHKRVVLLHGMTVNNQYIPSLPIACGQIREHDQADR